MSTNTSLANLSNDLLLWTVVAYSLAMLAYALDFALTQRSARAGVPASTRPGRTAVGINVVGWLLHISTALTRGLAVHRAPWGNMYEFAVMASLVGMTVYLGLLTRYPVRSLGAFVTGPIVLYLGLAGTVLYADAGPLVPALDSYWIWIHVAGGLTSTGAFMVAGIVMLLYLVKDRYEMRRAAAQPVLAQSFGPGAAATAEFTQAAAADAAKRNALLESLPAGASLERLGHRIITFAFPVWTFTIIAGAIWAEKAWSRAWGWDPKETWSFITWLAYAAYLHAHATGGWRGRKAAYLSLVGFACLLVNFYVVNTVIVGLHSYAGISRH